MFFHKKNKPSGIQARSIRHESNKAIVDVRGQTCPGYLLAINKAVETIQVGMDIELLITYPPCGEDVQAWCKERNITFIGLQQKEKNWVIKIRK